jgi:hypothetical protein
MMAVTTILLIESHLKPFLVNLDKQNTEVDKLSFSSRLHLTFHHQKK